MTDSRMVFIQAFLFSCLTLFFSCKEEVQKEPETDLPFVVDLGGNSWVVDNIASGMVSSEGIKDWRKADEIIETYVKLNRAGSLDLALKGRVLSGESKLEISVEGQTRTVILNNTDLETVSVGSFEIPKAGYYALRLKGVAKSSATFAEIKSFKLGGTATEEGITCVKDDFYFGRRGPSVHLRYPFDESEDIEYFYSEIEVPEEQDVIGSYFMANGFGEGYFGMQVNSETERRVLFSVWSPYQTDNPGDIPEDYRIELLKKGEGVHAGEFGNEGSGGQSYLVFPWKAGETYKFLLRGRPVSADDTEYTAYFYASEKGAWQLIAQFRRPHTHTYLTHLYSFLENFNTETGNISRYAWYKNQWAKTKEGQWIELKEAQFTADATAKKQARLDYSGGVGSKGFYLKNCGFFNDNTEMGSMFTREALNTHPLINLE
ncbi:DUF3472 domain-containing protein [Marinilongibacter aquaticus]|uniref:DUF3472 domain-containing protein n=1 Tax=Marinilongibacter aquaticus TaxID=2975157 RepID=UPI0021BD90C7|nr:DUF3472 domain-containing protein [Marinilongibacter aquaticus]UBM58388.1 DUF3472 domain-containing protein [Marinilongibacter aquaticus]